MLIGILSDTHGHLDERMIHHLSDCDEIWHAGDWLNIENYDHLVHSVSGEVKGVFGNVDGDKLRLTLPENAIFVVEGKKILIRHICGRPGRYNPETMDLIRFHKPNILICGHSHIALVEKDKQNKLIHINPGAAGRKGFHKFRTMVKLDLHSGIIQSIKMIELEERDI